MKRRNRHLRTLKNLGFCCVSLGILTATSPALASTIEDALACSQAQQKTEARRSGLLDDADRLGFEAERVSGSAREGLLQQAEELKNRYADLGLELLLRRDQCRSLTLAALEDCQSQIGELQSHVRTGKASPEEAGELVRLQTLRTDLQASLEAPAIHEYPLLELSAEDTEETLLAKRQYYEEVSVFLVSLEKRIEGRLEQVRDEAEALREAQRFVEDLSFVDMGDRSSGDALTQIKLPGGDPGDGGPNPRPSSSYPVESSASELDFALRLSPSNPGDSETILSLLETFRDQIRDRVDAINAETNRIDERVGQSR